MLIFDDFDAWGEAVRGADLRLACDGVETPQWRLAFRHVGPVVLQFGDEGGGNLCFGGNNHQGTLLWMPLGEPGHQVANCERCDHGSVLVIPPGADFCIQVRKRAHAWCSIALPGTTSAGDRGSPSHVVHADPLDVRRLTNLITRVVSAPEVDLVSPSVAEGLSQRLLAAASACLAQTVAPGTSLGRPKIERMEVVRRIVTALDADPMSGRSIADLATEAGVTTRTLGRVFSDTFGVSPRRYVQLRRLHTVRRALRGGDPHDDTVARVLARHGIWELGRFAGSYRRQFGESPSDTLYRRG